MKINWQLIFSNCFPYKKSVVRVKVVDKMESSRVFLFNTAVPWSVNSFRLSASVPSNLPTPI